MDDKLFFGTTPAARARRTAASMYAKLTAEERMAMFAQYNGLIEFLTDGEEAIAARELRNAGGAVDSTNVDGAHAASDPPGMDSPTPEAEGREATAGNLTFALRDPEVVLEAITAVRQYRDELRSMGIADPYLVGFCHCLEWLVFASDRDMPIDRWLSAWGRVPPRTRVAIEERMRVAILQAQMDREGDARPAPTHSAKHFLSLFSPSPN